MITFILGMIFAYVLIPILQYLVNYCQSVTQLANYKIAKEISIIKKEIEDLHLKSENENVQVQQLANPIGFQINYQENEDDQEEN